MALNKVTYVGKVTRITAANLNNIQDAIIDLEENSGSSVPTAVRSAILTLFEAGAYAETGLTDEIAIVESWASEVTSLSLSASTLTLNGDTPQTLVATTVPTGSAVTWTSSDTTIATVTGGIVTGVSNGTCTITAMSGEKSATCSVTVSGFAELVSISAVYTQSGTVYDTDSLDSLRDDLVVTATYDDTSTAVITNYILSGTLAKGTSVITVTYGGKATTFNVTVSSEWDVAWDYTMGLPTDNGFTLEATANADPVQTLEEDGVLFTVKGPSSQYATYSYNDTPSQSVMEFEIISGNVTNLQHYVYLSTNANNDGIGLRLQYSSGYQGIYLRDAEAIADMTKLTNFALNTRYKIKIEVVNNLANIYISDVIVAQNQTLYGYGAGATRIRTSSAGSGATRVNSKFISIKVK